jgi:spermidine/putrescine transport system permease protein
VSRGVRDSDTVQAEPPPATSQPDGGKIRRERRKRLTRFVLPGFTKLVVAYLMLPIAVMILYGFNKTPQEFPKVTFQWHGFTTLWYRHLLENADLTDALKNSLIIAFTSTIVCTILGTMMALALVRYKYRGRRVVDFVMFLNIAAPEIVMGSSLLSFLVTLNIHRGMGTIFVAHVMFNIAIVAITVRARLSGFDMAMEEAGMDLYAGPFETFTKITLPLIWPGILSGGLLAFALSIDDFVTTQFVAGQTVTFPLYIYGSVKTGIPPQVFVLGTLIFLAGVIIALGSLVTGRRKDRRDEVELKGRTADLALEASVVGERAAL